MNFLQLLSIRRNSEISDFSKVYPFSKISNSQIDDFSYVSFRCTINGCQIGKFCSIASGVKIGLGIHPTNFISSSPIFYSPINPLHFKLVKESTFVEHTKVLIGHDVWIGTNAVILDGVTIGNGAVIGANSLVTKDVEPYSIVGGLPAKEIKKRFSEQIISQLNELKWWNLPLSFFKQKTVKKIFSKPLDSESILNLIKLRQQYKLNN